MLAFLQNINPWIFFAISMVSGIAAVLIYTIPIKKQGGKSSDGSMKKWGENLKESGYSNLAFELTFSAKVAKDILKAWRTWQKGDLIENAKALTRRDFWLILAYVPFFVSMTLLVRSGVGPGLLFSAGLIFVAAPLVAGLLDVIENFYLLSMLKKTKGNVTSGMAMWASRAAFFKFMLLGDTILYWLVGIPVCFLQLIQYCK